MKEIYFIGGTMGIGKTTIAKALNKKLDHSVFLDGDWCWYANPFVVNDQTKKMVIDNITYLLNNFIKSDAYDYIIFCWVLDKQEIIDKILSNIDLKSYKVINISLTSDENSIVERLNKDIALGIRNEDVIKRSIEKIKLYDELKTVKIDTKNKEVSTVVNEILSIQ